MRPGEKHHLFEALKVAEGEQEVVDLLLDLVFARIEEGDEALHAEALNHLAQLLVNVRLYRLRVLVEDGRVHQFVLLGRLELHAVGVAERLDHRVEVGVEDDLLEAPHHLIEVVIVLVARPVVRHLKVLLIIIFTLNLQVPA